MNDVSIRYIANDVDAAVAFYSTHLGFEVLMRPAPGFAALRQNNLRLLLNAPGAGGAGESTPEGLTPEPGDWNRIQLEIEDLVRTVEKLNQQGLSFRNEIVTGKGNSSEHTYSTLSILMSGKKPAIRLAEIRLEN